MLLLREVPEVLEARQETIPERQEATRLSGRFLSLTAAGAGKTRQGLSLETAAVWRLRVTSVFRAAKALQESLLVLRADRGKVEIVTWVGQRRFA